MKHESITSHLRRRNSQNNGLKGENRLQRRRRQFHLQIMGRACCVLGCPSGGDAPSHQIPRNPELFQKWKNMIYSEKIQHMTDEQISRCTVCYRHFSSDDYLITFRVRKLKRGIIPSLNIPNKPTTSSDIPNIKIESDVKFEPLNANASVKKVERVETMESEETIDVPHIALFEDTPETLESYLFKQEQILSNEHVEHIASNEHVEHVSNKHVEHLSNEYVEHTSNEHEEHVSNKLTKHVMSNKRMEHASNKSVEHIATSNKPVENVSNKPMEHVVSNKPVKHVMSNKHVEHVVSSKSVKHIVTSNKPVEHTSSNKPVKYVVTSNKSVEHVVSNKPVKHVTLSKHVEHVVSDEHVEQVDSMTESEFRLYCKRRISRRKRARLSQEQLMLLRCKEQAERYERTSTIQKIMSFLTFEEVAAVKKKIRKSGYLPKVYVKVYNDIAKGKALFEKIE